ncbi:diguanylate cyclase [Niallia oryzisoli]|uniref:diguanylate cyclase n=1 Tax=Niallia oryzisoli TaxID=1737571 RepID=UPI0037357E67
MVKDLFIHVCIVITFLFIGGSIFRGRSLFNTFWRKIIFGFFSGILGSLLMLFTIRLTPTTIMDFRHISILMSALYGGPLSAGISVVIICLYRIVFITSSVEALLISLTNMVLIGIFSSFITSLRVSELKKWVYMYLFSLVMLSLGFFYLLDRSKGFYELMFTYWGISLFAGALIYYCANMIVQSNRSFNELKRNSTTDFLTGLYNVRHFHSAYHKAIEKSKADNEKLSLLIIDIDHFKKVNDTYGHLAGDEVLRQLGILLSTYTRSFDIISRMGGEEFSVLLFNCSNQLALEIGEGIRSGIENHPFILPDGKRIFLTISIGAATFMETTQNPNHLVKQADTALYKGKTTGRNKVCSIQSEIE